VNVIHLLGSLEAGSGKRLQQCCVTEMFHALPQSLWKNTDVVR